MTEYARLVLSVDSTSGLKAASDLDRLEAASRKAEGGLDKLEKQTKRNAVATGQLKTAVATLGATLVAAVSVSAVRSMAGLVQQYQEMAERVQMATSSTAEFELVQRRLLATANGTYRSLGEAQELYIRTADSLRSMGYSTQQALDVTDSMSYAFVKNATSAGRAETAISAFSKSMNTGRVAADQWETITTALPSVINDIAEATGRSAAEIRSMGAAGKLAARDLSEGLRKSLEDNAKAADGMATNLTDAGVRAETAVTAILVAVEKQSGAIQAVTNNITAAADSVLAFSEDTEAMQEALDGISTAAEYLAVAVGARLTSAMLAWTVSNGQALVALRARLIKERELLAAVEARSATERKAAMAALTVARAEFEAAKGTNAHTMAARNLSAAQAVALQAATGHAAAQNALNTAMTAGTVVANGLRSAMALLGGPAGVILLAAGALYTFASNARDAKPPVDLLTEAVNDLGDATLRALRADLLTKIETESSGAAGELTALNARVETLRNNLQRYPNSAKAQEWREELGLTAEKALVADEALEKYRKRLQAVDEEIGKRSAAPELIEPEDPTTSAEGKKTIARMREQLELVKLQGEARARLAAIQSLGADATKEEREEAERLATEIYRLNQAERGGASTSKRAKDGSQYVGQLERQVDLLGKSAVEVRRYEMAERELSGALLGRAEAALAALDASERQEAYKDLLRDLQTDEERLTETMRERLAVLDAMSELSDEERGKVAGRIAGGAIADAPDFAGVAPEIGGAQGELDKIAEAEQELQAWYATQLGMLEQYRQERADLSAQWDAEEQALHQEHQSKIADIERARQLTQLAAGEEFFGNMSGLTKVFAGEQSSAYRAMFALEKSYALAKVLMNAPKTASDAYSAMAGIPYVGPALGVAAAAAALSYQAAQAAGINSISLSGMAHDGIDSVPKEGTWLLDKGERVVDQRTNADLKEFLADGSSKGDVTIPIHVEVTAQQGVSDADAQRQGAAIAKQIDGQMMMVIAREKRPGGLLA